MSGLTSKAHLKTPPIPFEEISPTESALYTSDLLHDLHKMALGQGQNLLAHLLELARFEAKAIIKDEPNRQSQGR